VARREVRYVTHTDRTAFRRFPWIQLAFCIACLTMTAWTWMRFSYCWEVRLRDLVRPLPDYGTWQWPNDVYARLSGGAVAARSLALEKSRGFCQVIDPADDDSPQVVVHSSASASKLYYEQTEFVGRLSADMLAINAQRFWVLSASRFSRFHPASTAGLLVGTMGVFIFALYLRRWLAERRATA
jgi:hypothetical protein